MVQFKSRLPWLVVTGLFVVMLVTWCMAAVPVMAEGTMPFGKGRLFEVSKPGVPPSYVFGTMHVTDKDVLRLPPPIARAFKSSRLLLVESDGDPAEIFKVVDAMFFQDGRTLKDVLKPELYREVVTTAERLGIKEQEASRMRPWALWILLSDPGDENVRRVAGQAVLDVALQHYAAKRGVRIMALDRGEEIAALFTVGISEAEQALMLEDVLLGAEPFEQRYDALREAYLAGDLETLLMSNRPDEKTATEAERRFAEKFDRELLTERNRRWIPRMTRHLKIGGVFVAVGAAHLPGDTGVLRLLEKAGYQVKRVL